MECTEYQRSINRLRDGELTADESAAVFGHLASCTECRRFYFELQALDGALRRIPDRIPAVSDTRPLPLPAAMQARSWWDRRVALRVPVLALLLCATVAGLFALLPGGPFSREPESIYVTQLPAVVVETSMTPPKPRQ